MTNKQQATRGSRWLLVQRRLGRPVVGTGPVICCTHNEGVSFC